MGGCFLVLVLANCHKGKTSLSFCKFLFLNVYIYEPILLNESICEDPDDDKFFACAIACGGKVIVSGDKHLLKVSGYKDIEVYKPRDFVDKFLV